MSFRAFIQRVLFTLLLFQAFMAGAAAYANRSDEYCAAEIKGRYSERAVTREKKQHHTPFDAVLSNAGHCAPAASLPSFSFTGSGESPWLYGTVPFSATQLAKEGQSELRRWRITASDVWRDHLRALYPAHAFW